MSSYEISTILGKQYCSDVANDSTLQLALSTGIYSKQNNNLHMDYSWKFLETFELMGMQIINHKGDMCLANFHETIMESSGGVSFYINLFQSKVTITLTIQNRCLHILVKSWRNNSVSALMQWSLTQNMSTTSYQSMALTAMLHKNWQRSTRSWCYSPGSSKLNSRTPELLWESGTLGSAYVLPPC